MTNLLARADVFHVVIVIVIQGFADKYGIRFLETSAKNGNNVDSACRRLHRKQSAAASETLCTVTPQASTEYVVERVVRKRWRLPIWQSQYHYSSDGTYCGDNDLIPGSTAEYEVKWLGYDEMSWEPVKSFTLCIPAIEFERSQCDRRHSVRPHHPLDCT